MDQKIIDYLFEKNGNQYNLLKAAEECSELATVLLQKALKPNKVKDQEILDEIGDTYIRLEVLKKMFSEQKINERIDYKLSKFKEHKDHKIYEKI